MLTRDPILKITIVNMSLNRSRREEAEFAKNYRDSIDGLFKSVALSKMPGNNSTCDSFTFQIFYKTTI